MMPYSRAMTPKQQKVYAFVRDRIQGGHPAPSIREVAEHCGLGDRSAMNMLDALEWRGLIVRPFGVPRGIRLLGGEAREGTAPRA